MVTENYVFSAHIFSCKICNVICRKKHDYDRHILTNKHIGNTLGNTNSAQQAFQCENCRKIYKSRKGLWGHNKNSCNNKNTNTIVTINEQPYNSDMKVLTNLVLEIMKSNTELQKQCNEFQKQNCDLQKQVIEVCNNIQPSNIITNSNNNTNSNNKTFNLQFFLNEQCKDAMNLSEFIESFQLQIKDLEKVGKLGYVDGISDIIVQKLNELDITQRPMHCSDFKRETIYVKDEGIWEKEGPTNNKVKKVVGHVSKHNLNLLNSWKDLHPCCLNSNSPHNGHYLHLIKESLGGPNDMNLTENKIIKKISKEIVIDKKD
jgi:hypothetical protein